MKPFRPIPRTRERGPSPLSGRSCARWLRAIHARALAGEMAAMAALVILAISKRAITEERKAKAALI